MIFTWGRILPFSIDLAGRH